ncbi:MAG: serine--tRNA ligase [Elusimicrobia bacterium RIFCSPLOWO2_01_FULL_60_11]|nr:MAG: serine--tRNA ligase [Elusimicrobia bacterium RIFCSPLOWO2_01_FULL_60_11]
MIDIKRIKDNPKYIQDIFASRGQTDPDGLSDMLARHKELMNQVEALRTRRNQVSEEFQKLKMAGKDTGTLSGEVEKLKKDLPEKEKDFADVEARLNDVLLRIPNALHESVPKGRSAEDNPEIRKWGEPRKFDFEPKPHWELGENLGILDFEAAGRISGSGFAALKGAGAALERALISFMLDLHTKEHGYSEVLLPYLVTPESMKGTGQLPKFADEMYKMAEDDLYLIPTAEVSVTNLHRGEVLDEAALPRKYASYSACFRREAGSYGKDTKGLIRNHQFNKVELVWFTKPETSFSDLEVLTKDAEDVLKKIGIPYRVIQLCSGDTGFASAKTYDLEVWMPGEKRWREISSCSCFTDFQARRMNIKYKDKAGKKELLHTLNGSGVAAGRLFAAVLENFQEKDGSVSVPKILQEYIKMEKIRV